MPKHFILKRQIKEFIFKFLVNFLPSQKTESPVDNSIGITALLCHRYVDMFIYSISSFFYSANRPFPIFIVSDGSLTEADKKKLSKFFTVIIPSKKWCDTKMKKLLKNYPSFTEYRFSQNYSKNMVRNKFDAFLLNPFDRFINFDSDVLFYKKPKEVLDWLYSKKNLGLYSVHEWKEKTRTNDDLAMVVRRLLRKIFSATSSHIYMSCGMIGFPNKECIDLAFLDKVFKLAVQVEFARHFIVEEDALIILFDKIKSKILSANKYLNLWLYWQYQPEKLKDITYLHYAGEVKERFQKDAVKLAISRNLFRPK